MGVSGAFSRFDSPKQGAGVGELFVDRLNPLAEGELAAFQTRESVGGGDHIEQKLLTAAGAWLTCEIEPVARL